MAKSGQCSTHHMQAVQRSGYTARGWPSAPATKTSRGQKAIHRPQPLHQFPNTRTSPWRLCRGERSPCGAPGPTAFASTSSAMVLVATSSSRHADTLSQVLHGGLEADIRRKNARCQGALFGGIAPVRGPSEPSREDWSAGHLCLSIEAFTRLDLSRPTGEWAPELGGIAATDRLQPQQAGEGTRQDLDHGCGGLAGPRTSAVSGRNGPTASPAPGPGSRRAARRRPRRRLAMRRSSLPRSRCHR
jgi:hypothetical protein